MLLALLMVKLVCVCYVHVVCCVYCVRNTCTLYLRFCDDYRRLLLCYIHVNMLYNRSICTHRFIYINISCFRCTHETEREKGINRHNIHQIVAYVIYILSTWTYSYIRTYIDWSYRLFIYLYIITLDCRRVNSLLYSHYSTNIVCNAFASHILSIVW